MSIHATVPVPEPALSLAEGAGLLTELSETLTTVERGMARAVDLVGRLERAGVVEHLEGLPLELFLALQHRLTSADRRMLAEAARVLGRLPVTRGLFSEQKLSWSQVRGIVTRLRRMPVDDLAEIDARVAASVERIDAYSPDELVWAVERAADEINGARKVQRREQRQIAANFLAVQPCLDGAVSLYGELDSVAGATAPLRWSDCHHIVPREDNGTHHPENLAYLARRWHLLVHRQGWEQHLDPQTGELTITRNGRAWLPPSRDTPRAAPSAAARTAPQPAVGASARGRALSR